MADNEKTENPQPRAIVRTYDAMGQRISEAIGPPEITDPPKCSAGSDGRVTCQVFAGGRITAFRYDGQGSRLK